MVRLQMPKRTAEVQLPRPSNGSRARFFCRYGCAFFQFFGRIVIRVITKFWALSGKIVLALLLTYWAYGGWMVFLLLAFATTGVLYQAADWLLYHPDHPPHSRLYIASPQIFGLPHENIFVKSKDGVQINLVLIKQAPEFVNRAPTMVYLHGNAGNIGHRLLNAKELHQHSGCNILMVEYRGYGRSDGSPSEQGLYWDAQAALDFLLLRPDIDRRKIILFGRSLGGAVAVDLASQADYADKILMLILENTFTSVPDMGKILFNLRIIKLLPDWLSKNQFQSKKKIPTVQIPSLFISGLSDALIPFKMMQELYEMSGSKLKRVKKFASGTHNETWRCPGYYEAINRFIDDVLIAVEENTLNKTQPSSCVVNIDAEVILALPSCGRVSS